MKRYISMLLAVFLLLTCVLAGSPGAAAAAKAGTSRAIAIVFDNSGSMYDSGDQAWCRATYAMEVFASMLNVGDTLLIYPMHPITVGGKEYTMEDPLRITDAAQAATIRDIFTTQALGTPIESVDCAVQGLKNAKADKKYMIVVTDGDSFYRDGAVMTHTETKQQLDACFQEQAGKTMTVMYLGIGNNVIMPDTKQSDFFVKKQANNSEDVLSSLTEMCNQIFGRDTLPKENLSGNKVEFDISMSTLILFVQGVDVSNLKLNGAAGSVGQQISTATTKYGTAGCGNYTSTPDTSLQGMMVTYSDCAAGGYTIEYAGTATSIELYYEPDADLDFVFTDAAGNTVDPNALYAGDYKVSFGMKDAKTGKLISSNLLGKPHYEGSYSINGEEHPIALDGDSGEVPVSLEMNDAFDAKLTVTYLSGYTITKDSTDFGWPEGGIQVAARPAGELKLEITGGTDSYSLQDLEEGAPYTAKVFYQGTQLTGKELENVSLKWDPDTSNAEIKQSCLDDHYDLTLHYKNPADPQNTVCGDCTVSICAFYSAPDSGEAQTQTPLTYNIVDDFSPLQMELIVPQDYIVISELGDSQPLTVKLTSNGVPLTAEEFAAVDMQVDCGGLEHTVTACEQDSAYQIQLLPTDGIKEGDCSIQTIAQFTDHIGRTTQVDDSANITLSAIPLWLKWAIGLLALLILFLIAWTIMHIRVLPGKAHVTKRDSTMIFDGENESKSTTFRCKIAKGQMALNSTYAGTRTGFIMDVRPGKESYLCKPQVKRSAEVKNGSLRRTGTPVLQEISIGAVRYLLNEDTGRLERTPKSDTPLVLKHGIRVAYSGTMLSAGVPRAFSVTTKLNFKKK